MLFSAGFDQPERPWTGANIAPVSELAHLGQALRVLRERSGLKQFEAAEKAGLAISVVNRAETGKGTSSLGTVSALLRLYGRSFVDLGSAMHELGGTPVPMKGTPRAAWVSVLVRHGVDPRALEGAAADALAGGDPKAEADLFASAEEAARQLTAAAVAEIRRAAARLAERD